MIDVFLYLIYFALCVSMAAIFWSLFRTMKHQRHDDGVVHNIPRRKIALSILATVVVILIATFSLGSTEPVTIGLSTFNDPFWLRVANMLICTSIILIIIPLLHIIFYRKK